MWNKDKMVNCEVNLPVVTNGLTIYQKWIDQIYCGGRAHEIPSVLIFLSSESD